MSSKELMYVEDALSHEEFLITQCRSAVSQLQDTQLKQEVQNVLDRHSKIYRSFYQLV